MLQDAGDVRGAAAAYRRADAIGNGRGAFNLGVLLEARGDIADAEAANQRAEERGHTRAAYNLGYLVKGRGDIVGAREAFARAAAGPAAAIAMKARLALADLPPTPAD